MVPSPSAALQRPPWLRLARAAWWVAFVTSVIVMVGALPGYARNASDLELEAGFSGLRQFALRAGLLLSIGTALLCLGLAALVFLRKPGDAMAVFFSFFLLIYGIVLVGPLEHFLPYWFPQSGELGLLLQGVILPIPTLILVLIFPNGRFIPRSSRALVPVTILVLLYEMIALALEQRGQTPPLPSGAAYLALAIIVPLAIGIQFYRYRRVYNSTERQQAKWVLIGLAATFGLAILVSIPYYYRRSLPPGTPELWWTAFNSLGWWFSLMILPVTMTIAILRHRLFDIDVIIRRTLIYSILSGLLALTYFGSVVVLQGLFTAVTGQQSPVVVVLSTLAIAALFFPLRNRVQDFIDRRFYRKKYDAAKVIAEFAATCRDETDLDKLTARLVEVVEETMQPENISLWLKDFNAKPALSVAEGAQRRQDAKE